MRGKLKIAVIADVSPFKLLKKRVLRVAPEMIRTSNDNYMEAGHLCLYRISDPRNNFVHAFAWSAYYELFDWCDAGDNLFACMDMFKEMNTPLWTAAEIDKEIQELKPVF